MAYLYEMPHARLDDETKKEYRERTKRTIILLSRRCSREYGPRYAKRNAEKNSAGGYTRIYKLGLAAATQLSAC